MNILPVPPGAVAKAHYHTGIETIAYMLEGECVVYYGDHLQKRALVQQGEQCFVAADVPHAPSNEVPSQAARLHPTLSALPSGKAAGRTGLAA